MQMNQRLVAIFFFVVATYIGDGSFVAFATDDTGSPDFEAQIAPLLILRCLECHQDGNSSGGLSLESRERLIQGGDSGPVISFDEPNESYFIERIVAGEMPSEENGDSQKLPSEEIDLLRRWIAAGATWPEHRVLNLYEATTEKRAGRDWWSLQAVVKPLPPAVDSVEQVRNPIDAFIIASLEEAHREPAPLAEKRVLIQRVYYDVVGLPPTYEQIQAFVADQRDDAWEHLVDTLLASPHYGEKWARHWLDLVRFAETCGYERDQEKPFAWRYRDWVVESLNEDKPYDRFVLEQLAGDEVPNHNEQTVIGTGFLRLGTWNDEPNEPQDYKYERLEDLVHATSTAFLGLSVKCARCHDHKFDPIPQKDYYRLAAAFWPGSIEPRDVKLLGGPTPDELGYENVLGWTDVSKSTAPFNVLIKGSRHDLGDQVQAGALTAVVSMRNTFDPPSERANSTTRRLQLAHWIANPKNPLTGRVMVNRLWQHHFGNGLVRTPNNFGFRGDPPTHPKLLDWLTSEFVEGGWKLKRIHKLMLMSRTYCQSAQHPHFDEYAEHDATNRLWWRAERRRLDAEALRDTMLLVTGELDRTFGGPSFRASVSPSALEGLSRKDAAWRASPAEQQRRRSLYMFTQRSLLPPIMTTFNFSDTVAPCGARDVTTAPTQALALLNNAFSHDRSMALAERAREAKPERLDEQVNLVWRFALGREPTIDEEQLAQKHLIEQSKRFENSEGDEHSVELLSLASLCHVLMNTNEFIYVD